METEQIKTQLRAIRQEYTLYPSEITKDVMNYFNDRLAPLIEEVNRRITHVAVNNGMSKAPTITIRSFLKHGI